MKLTCYYAHPVTTYDSLIESNDIKLLKRLEFEVINPNTLKIQEEYQEYIDIFGKLNGMQFFEQIIRERCHILAFRAFPDGMIESGVTAAINEAFRCKLPIIELPQDIESRSLSEEETATYLYQVGFYKITKI
jgi:hypothetical protein